MATLPKQVTGFGHTYEVLKDTKYWPCTSCVFWMGSKHSEKIIKETGLSPCYDHHMYFNFNCVDSKCHFKLIEP